MTRKERCEKVANLADKRQSRPSSFIEVTNTSKRRNPMRLHSVTITGEAISKAAPRAMAEFMLWCAEQFGPFGFDVEKSIYSDVRKMTRRAP